MNKIYLKSGDVINTSDFQPKSENLIKVRLHNNDADGEGIWACLPDEAMTDYDADVTDEKPIRYATLRNDSVYLGMGSWGLLIPVKFCGENRPECNVAWIDEGSEPIYNKKDTKEAEKAN